MNAKQLYDKCLDTMADTGEPNFVRCQSHLMEYQRSHCYHPKFIKVFDSHLGKFVKRQIPCGCCYHCTETKINEWVTRLHAHADFFAYIYFVTLTYRSFDKVQSRYDDYLQDYLKDALFHLDSYNQLHRECYSPCYFPKSHYQNYFKRLRKNTGIQNISMFGCSEYGHNYARPHFHFIIFSPQEISKEQFTRAWGLFLTEKEGIVSPAKNDKGSVFCPFGRIQVDDLVSNGTLGNAKVDGKLLDSHHCFAYVAKYIGKKEFNTNRLKFIYDDYEKSLEPYSFFTDCTPTNFKEFVSQFKPYSICSRGLPIGSLFVKAHLDEMANGVFARPALQTKGAFIVPSYFRRKAAESVFGLRIIKAGSSASKGNLPAIASSMSNSIKTDLPLCFGSIPSESAERNRFLLFTDCTTREENLQYLLRSDCFVDLYRKSRFLPVVEWQGSLPFPYIFEYKYSKELGKWKFYDCHDLDTWCLHYLSSMQLDFAKYLELNNKTLESERYYKTLLDFYATFGKEDIINSLPAQIEQSNENFFKMRNIARYQSTNL